MLQRNFWVKTQKEADFKIPLCKITKIGKFIDKANYLLQRLEKEKYRNGLLMVMDFFWGQEDSRTKWYEISRNKWTTYLQSRLYGMWVKSQ